MDKKKVVKLWIWILNIFFILLLVWSLINYKFLDKEVTGLVMTGGLIAMIFLVIFLEGAPIFVGPSVAVASILVMNVFNPWFILFLFLSSAIIGNIFYFCLVYFVGAKILKYFPKKDIKKYKELFKKYGRYALLIMAVSPIHYLPTLAGVFKMDSKKHLLETLAVRLIRHVFVFFVWFFVLFGF